jgi:hypothetical protein
LKKRIILRGAWDRVGSKHLTNLLNLSKAEAGICDRLDIGANVIAFHHGWNHHVDPGPAQDRIEHDLGKLSGVGITELFS